MMLALSIALAVPLCLLCFLVDDRRTRFFLALFVWGALSGFFAAEANDYATARFDLTHQVVQIQFAPIAEEAIKAAPLFGLYAILPRYVRSREIIVGGIFVGFGFSVVENFSYMLMRPGMETTDLVVYVVTRSVSTTIMHGIGTGIIGFALYFVARGAVDAYGFRPVYIFMGYSFAILCHALFNLVVQFERMGEVVAVIGALLVYGSAWMFVEFVYRDLEASQLPSSVVGDEEHRGPA